MIPFAIAEAQGHGVAVSPQLQPLEPLDAAVVVATAEAQVLALAQVHLGAAAREHQLAGVIADGAKSGDH